MGKEKALIASDLFWGAKITLKKFNERAKLN